MILTVPGRFTWKLDRIATVYNPFIRIAMGPAVLRCGRHYPPRDILFGYAFLSYTAVARSTSLPGLIWKMDPSRMPRAFCIGWWFAVVYFLHR